MATTPPTATTAEQAELAQTMALIAATLYGALLKVEVEDNPQCVKHFTTDQAFTLVNSMFYQAIKDEDLI
jgi:hypothetical protein